MKCGSQCKDLCKWIDRNTAQSRHREFYPGALYARVVLSIAGAREWLSGLGGSSDGRYFT
jgi:hypothetical protein